MKRLPIPNTVLEVGYVTVAAVVGIIVLGRLTQTSAYKKLETLPVAGAIATGVESAVMQVWNP